MAALNQYGAVALGDDGGVPGDFHGLILSEFQAGGRGAMQ